MSSEILNFWFNEIKPSQWFVSDPEFDTLIRQRFSSIHTQACSCELYEWRKEPTGRLAEIIILDQFSRNIFRDSAKAFAGDALALALAQEAITAGADKALEATQRSFLYMPFMHSESRAIHEVAVQLFSQKGLENNLAFELKHKKIIDQFGRYPHRNDVLGRTSSAEEIRFLQQPGSRF